MNSFYPAPLQQQVAVSGLPKPGLDTLNYQQQPASNPFQLKFHHNVGTSCSDLLNWPTQVPGSRKNFLVIFYYLNSV